MAQHDGGINWTGLILLGVGGWLIWDWLTASATPVASTATAQPGTTPTMNQSGQVTSVSTASQTTPPPSGTMQTLAQNMVNTLGTTNATADQWNFAYAKIMGQGIDKQYGLNFDSVYGPITSAGVRNNGATMTALTFIQLAASAHPGGLPGLSGLGSAIARFSGRWIPSYGNMIYMAHHPLPYSPTYNLRGFRGLGAYTQASGMEKALWQQGHLRGNRIR